MLQLKSTLSRGGIPSICFLLLLFTGHCHTILVHLGTTTIYFSVLDLGTADSASGEGSAL
jgi:hypothetical protein